MFNSKKQVYSRKTPTTAVNDYGEKITTFASSGTVLMFISLSNEEMLQSADMRIQQCSHIGITKDTLSIGDVIDDKYEVQFINSAGRENIIYMKEKESDGTFDWRR